MEYALIFCLTFALYFKTLRYGLVVDDLNWYGIVQKYKVNWFHSFWNAGNIRWYKLKNMLYGCGLFKHPSNDHLLTTALTFITGCLIYKYFGSLMLALIWIAHPANNQVNIWLNGRRYQLSVIFGLLALMFVPAGILLYPIALFFHPISAPFMLFGFFQDINCLFWLIPMFLMSNYIYTWFKDNHQNAQEGRVWYHTYEPGKLIMAIKLLGDYTVGALLPTKFTMYGDNIYGVADIKREYDKAYAVNGRFWLSIALLSSMACLCILIGGSCLTGAFLAIIAIFPWLGIKYSPTQIYAQRYSVVFNIGAIMVLLGVTAQFPTYSNIIEIVFLTWCFAVTFKDLEMYRDYHNFHLKHVVEQPLNRHANNKASYAFQAARNEAPSMEYKILNDCLHLSTDIMYLLRTGQTEKIKHIIKQR